MTGHPGTFRFAAGGALVAVAVLLAALKLAQAGGATPIPTPAAAPTPPRAARPAVLPASPGVEAGGDRAADVPPTERGGDLIPVQRVRVREVQVTIVRVPEGVSAQEIADILQFYGVVEDAEEFLRVARRRSATTRLRAGVHHFTRDDSLEAVVDRLLGSPPSEYYSVKR